MVSGAYQGSLFTNDFVEASIVGLPEWEEVTDAELGDLGDELRRVFATFPTNQTPNEATTEKDLIWPILEAMGWTEFLTQQNLTATGRQDVPDALLFLDLDTKTRANADAEEWRRYELVSGISAYGSARFGEKSVADLVLELVLELNYTAADMTPFAQEFGYVNNDGTVKTPFVWDDERRLNLRAKLDAVYFLLYGINNRDDVRYIYSTFPIVEREEQSLWGSYRSRDLCLEYMNALSAGDPDAIIKD